MAKMGIVENGLRRRGKKRRRRNPVTAAKVRSKNPARRSVSLSTAKSVLKRNGLKTVSLKSVANGRKRHKRRRRNGLVVARRKNGFFGNTKGDAMQVLQLGVGAIGVKMVGGSVAGMVSPLLSQVGLGQYAGILTDAGVALFVAPFVADKVSRGSGKMVRLGGLLTVALDAVEMFFPNLLSFNPFNNNPVVMTNSGAAIAPSAVAALAQGVANSGNPQAAAARIGSLMAAADNAGSQRIGSMGAYAGMGVADDGLVV